jgi:hypothetical protein
MAEIVIELLLGSVLIVALAGTEKLASVAMVSVLIA